MTVLQVPFTYYPNSVGGTEIYVEALARNLESAGVASAVAAPGDTSEEYDHNGIPVHRYSTSSCDSPGDLYGTGDAQAAKAFGDILENAAPDLVHLHAHTRGVSLRIAEVAEERGLPVVLTYHTPTVSCMRGTLLHRGDTICDGVMDRSRCASCVLQEHGMPDTIATMGGRLPTALGKLLESVGVSGGGWTALQMPNLVERQHSATRALFDTVDHIVAVCEWVRDLLIRNDVPQSKVSVSRQGLPQAGPPSNEGGAGPSSSAPEDVPATTFGTNRPLRLIFLGRVHPTKGLHVILRALARVPDAPVRLNVYGIVQEESNYVRSVRELIDADERVEQQDPVPSTEVPACIHAHDALVVPSQWLETGPLVVYEAFAAERPVIGSDLGGIAELVTDGTDGILVSPHDDIPSWSDTITEICQASSLVRRLQDGIREPRTMKDAAQEMISCYRTVLKGASAPGNSPDSFPRA